MLSKSQIKLVKSLKHKKYRNNYNLFIVEGLKGILEAKKISAIAEAKGVQIAPHLYCGPIVAAANIQISTCIPNFLILECINKMDGFYSDILKKPIQWEDGFIIPSKEPGLGIEIDEKVINKYPYDEKELHLQVSNKIIDF